MGILCTVCVWHSIVPLIDNTYGYKVANITDLAALGLLGGLYFMFHVCFFLYIYFVVSIYLLCAEYVYEWRERVREQIYDRSSAHHAVCHELFGKM